MAGATARAPSSWAATIDRTTSRVFGVLSLVLISIWLPNFHEQGWWNVAIAAIVTVVAGRALAGVAGTIEGVALNLAMVLAIVLCLQLSHDPDPANRSLNPAFPILAITQMGTAFLLRARMVPLALTTGSYALGMVVLAGASLIRTLDEIFATTGACVMLALLIDGFRRAARAADAARAAARDSEQVVVERAARERALEDRRRILHDDVLSVLATIEHSAHLDPDDVRELCRSQADALRGEVGQADPAEDLATTIAQEFDSATGLEIITHVDPHFDPAGIPNAVLAAMVSAGAEALRNVERHAGVDRAEVHISGNERDAMVVEVRDSGVGIHPAQAEGFGLRSSVRGRLAEVGGVAEISSSARHGTRVRLRWQRTPSSLATVSRPASVQALLRRNEGLQRIIFWMAVAGCSGQLWMALRYPATDEMLVPGLVLTAAITAFHLLVAVRVSRGLVPFTEHLVIQVVLWAALVGGLWIAGPGALLGFRSWIVGLVTFTMVFLAFSAPWWRSVCFAGVASAIVVVAVLLDPQVQVSHALAPISQPVLYVGLAALAMVVVGAGAEALARDEEVLASHLADVAFSTAREQVFDDQFATLLTPLVDFLDEVATGALHPGAPEARERARLLAFEARDDLYLPGVIEERNRDRIRELRRAGARITLRAGSGSGAATARVNEMLDQVLALVDRAHPVTCSLAREDAPYDRAVVTGEVDPDAAATLAAWATGCGGTVERQPWATTLVVPVDGLV
ncbi:ATP-binding protein [Nocardioides sp. AE5]|uniref:sensor histidine kinase n=1 Tax=Nocardioides sp. AE5 TaxID=2962573 RepID=UPI002882815C|nr:ATP-binding protein [Nocardioides sp. AE5]MDT0202348.1 hypothetical protein [Nocardioides sp. AE5]